MQLTFCVSEGGPRYEVTFAVVELHNFKASFLISRATLDQLHCRFDMHHTATKAAIHFARPGCTHAMGGSP